MKLPYKYRGLVLLGLLVIILPWGTWSYALHGTLVAWLECRRIEQLLAQMPTGLASPSDISSTEQEMILSGLLLDAVRIKSETVGVSITGYEPVITQEQDGMAIHTARLTLTGSYNGLLRVVEEVGISITQCPIRSLTWRSSENLRTHRTHLVLTLYLQQIILKA